MEDKDNNKPVEKKLRTFEADIEEYRKFKSTLTKDGKDVGEALNEFIKKFNLEYGDGNPAYTIDQWFDKNAMLAIPAVMRAADDWGNWYFDCNDKEMIQKIIWQSQMIGARGAKRLQQIG